MLAGLILLALIAFVLLRCEARLTEISEAVHKLDWRQRKRFPILPGEQEDEDLDNEMAAWQPQSRR